MKFFIVLEIKVGVKDFDSLETIFYEATTAYGCIKIEEYSLDENEIHNIFGHQLLLRDELGSEIIQKIEDYKNKGDSKEIAFVFDKEHGNQVILFLAYLRTQYPSIEVIKCETLKDDWVARWKDNYQTICISPTMHISPSWEIKKNSRLDTSNIVYINPGMGFGTGGHETTKLCLLLFEELVDQKKIIDTGRCLDLGCGSGILGLFVVKKTNMSVTFCDVDVEAMDNCLENIMFNFSEMELDKHAIVLRSRLDSTVKYDLIFANILEATLIEECEFLKSSLSEGGWLILSGILENQADNVIKLYSELKLIDRKKMSDWNALLFRKSK